MIETIIMKTIKATKQSSLRRSEARELWLVLQTGKYFSVYFVVVLCYSPSCS